MKRFFVIIFSILIFSSVSAQRTADLGLWGGVGSYTGDMTDVDMASSLNPNVGLFLRYNFNSRVSLRTSAMLGTIGATGMYEETPWDFNKFMTDLSLMGEFNFFRYLIGSKRYGATTYLLGGIGTSLFTYTYDPVRMSQNQMLFYLQNSELQKLPADVYGEVTTGADKSTVGLNVPIGFGFKFNVGSRLGIGVEAILRKYFNDKVDDLDDPRKYYVQGTTAADGTPTSGSWKTYNSFLHNNDFTFHVGVHLTYRFFNGNSECPVYENIN